MKSITQLDNTAKAKLLHELFPEEVKPFIDHLKQVCLDFEQHQQQYRESWDFGFFSFDEWLSLSRQTMQRIEKFEFNIVRSSKIFSSVSKIAASIAVLLSHLPALRKPAPDCRAMVREAEYRKQP